MCPSLGDAAPDDDRDSTRDVNRVQSVDRAVTVLEFLARNGWSGVTEIGEALDVHKSTAFRLVSTLAARGLAEQHAETGLYHLGFGLVHLARAVTVGPDIARRARTWCEWLAERTSETVTLSVLEGEGCVTIDQIVADSTVVSRSWLGKRVPLHCTASGKATLAFMPLDEQAEIVAGPHKRYTERTITEPAHLAEVLGQIRTDGFAECIEEYEEGLCAVAAPVLAADGRVVATIDVSGPTYRLGEAELAAMTPLVVEAASHASTRFGYTDAGNGD
jgi:DNA-binding IclR family transcriptional regulator